MVPVVAARTSSACLLVMLGLSSGCYHYRAAPAHVAAATQPRRETLWSLAWGAVQQRVEPKNCPRVGLAEVTVSTNLGFALLTVVSLGFAAPATVAWTCA